MEVRPNTPRSSLIVAAETPWPTSWAKIVSPTSATHSPTGGRTTWAVTSGLMAVTPAMSKVAPIRFTRSIGAVTRDVARIGSPATTGTRNRHQSPLARSPPGSVRRKSMAIRRNSGIPAWPVATASGGGISVDGSNPFVVTGAPATPAKSVLRMRRTRARAWSIPPVTTRRSTTWIFFPSRTMSCSMRRGSPTGTGRTRSAVTRDTLIGVSVGMSSSTWPSRARTAPPLCASGLQPPAVMGAPTKASPTRS